ncbi:MAG: malate/lactate/ureidoglycolate dehydrogenase [Burkholderiaceae bacterium]|nr:malate/lactate/ureidoglycolate dehydrogenase [Burkholderiaceae bacterium]MCD8516167.1 malate/lactate/ureidoglycolate dehydrogenase [Burkholderiaceae bacterium]MCD8536698.1 malate/lactate/ureidoglycolate dehydrogenase [Burkholderiaceae bacterium]MCD8566175.1 malate/lactate/ureidoglycolate dehydrogenase [Burkholderiaceae bacterium]
MAATMHYFNARALKHAIEEVVKGFGSEPTEVELVTNNLIEANLTGHDSHGIGMLPRYALSLKEENGLKANAHVSFRVDHGTMIGLDGHAGFGQVIGHEAMLIGIERAREHGSCIMSLGNVHHLCRIGAWAEMATAAGLISIHFVNVMSKPVVAPWDGADGRFGTNPFCVGIPVAGRAPVILDFATSVIAQGKTRVAHNKGIQLKPGQLIDNHGQPTTDPVFAVKPPYGAIKTFGEHKGFGLSLVCELLGGALSGGATLHERANHSRVFNGMLTILIDPDRLAQDNLFVQESLAFLDWVKQSPAIEGTEGVKIAGEPEQQTKAERLRSGIPVDENTWQEILNAAKSLGVDTKHVDAMARN